jgi:hypothetical protein
MNEICNATTLMKETGNNKNPENTKHKNTNDNSIDPPASRQKQRKLQNNVKQKDGPAIQIANTTPNDSKTKFTPRIALFNCKANIYSWLMNEQHKRHLIIKQTKA